MHHWVICARTLSYSTEPGEYVIKHTTTDYQSKFFLEFHDSKAEKIELLAAGSIPELMSIVDKKEKK